MLGLRTEIRALSELRLKLQNEAHAAWQDLAGNVQPGPEAQALTAARLPQFEALIEHDNTKLHERLIPAYRKMLDLFREKIWLAEDETRGYYAEFVEFVDIWERWLAGSLPPELIERTGHTEQKLHPFYKHLEAQHLRLRRTVARGLFR